MLSLPVLFKSAFVPTVVLPLPIVVPKRASKPLAVLFPALVLTRQRTHPSHSQRVLTRDVRWDDLQLRSEWSLSESGARRHLWATWVGHVDPSQGTVWNNLNCDINRLRARLVNHVVYVPASDVSEALARTVSGA
jgi:hypothetical protein